MRTSSEKEKEKTINLSLHFVATYIVLLTCHETTCFHAISLVERCPCVFVRLVSAGNFKEFIMSTQT